MARSPLVRFLLAGLLIVLIVTATFAYGNSQRAKQQQDKRTVSREQRAKEKSEQEREAQKQQAQKDAQKQEEAKKQQAAQADTSASSPATDTSSVTLPSADQIPTTGSSAALSAMLAATILPVLASLGWARRKVTARNT